MFVHTHHQKIVTVTRYTKSDHATMPPALKCWVLQPLQFLTLLHAQKELQHCMGIEGQAQHSTAQHSTACRHSHAQVPFYCHRCYHGSSVIGHRVSQLQRLQVSLLEKKQNDYTIWHQSNEKPSIILGYPGFSLLPYSRTLSWYQPAGWLMQQPAQTCRAQCVSRAQCRHWSQSESRVECIACESISYLTPRICHDSDQQVQEDDSNHKHVEQASTGFRALLLPWMQS